MNDSEYYIKRLKKMARRKLQMNQNSSSCFQHKMEWTFTIRQDVCVKAPDKETAELLFEIMGHDNIVISNLMRKKLEIGVIDEEYFDVKFNGDNLYEETFEISKTKGRKMGMIDPSLILNSDSEDDDEEEEDYDEEEKVYDEGNAYYDKVEEDES